jgi:hypothetical protein
MRSSLFWVTSQNSEELIYTLKIRLIGCPETQANNCLYTLRNVPECVELISTSAEAWNLTFIVNCNKFVIFVYKICHLNIKLNYSFYITLYNAILFID